MSKDRISKALSELMSASREVYGDDLVLDIQFNIAMGHRSRTDLSDMGIDDIIGDDIDGNK